MLGDNTAKLLTTKNELDNVNLIAGLQGFFDPGLVTFEGGNILLGGAGNDRITGGGGNDIIDGDAWLHVGLTSYTAGASIIRQINYDPNGNTYDPSTAAVTFDDATGLVTSFTPGTGHVNAANVDIAIFNDLMSNYNVGTVRTGCGRFPDHPAQRRCRRWWRWRWWRRWWRWRCGRRG